MTVRNLPTIEDPNPVRTVSAVRQLAQGRSNAVGSVTLTPNAAETTVAFVNCAEGSHVFLAPETSNAAAALSGIYVSAIGNGSFTITHSVSADTDRTFGYAVLG